MYAMRLINHSPTSTQLSWNAVEVRAWKPQTDSSTRTSKQSNLIWVIMSLTRPFLSFPHTLYSQLPAWIFREFTYTHICIKYMIEGLQLTSTEQMRMMICLTFQDVKSCYMIPLCRFRVSIDLYCTVWHCMVLYGTVRCGMVWYGMVWYGMVWYCMSSQTAAGSLRKVIFDASLFTSLNFACDIKLFWSISISPTFYPIHGPVTCLIGDNSRECIPNLYNFV